MLDIERPRDSWRWRVIGLLVMFSAAVLSCSDDSSVGLRSRAGPRLPENPTPQEIADQLAASSSLATSDATKHLESLTRK